MFKKFLFFFVLFFSLYQELSSLAFDTNTPTPKNQVLFYHLEGTIHGGTVETFNQIYTKAKKENFEAILIELDTPGGLLDSTEEIVKLFLNSDIPIIVYVAPSGAKAGSAGTFITMAAHVAAMAPGTYIGAAHPVMMFGGGKEDDEQSKIMKQKIESATTSFIEAIAKQRGRNQEWAKKAVLESKSITEDVALKENVIDVVAQNKEDLLKKIHGREIKLAITSKKLKTQEAVVVTFNPSFKLKFLNAIASPGFMYLMILAIIAGIYLEISKPGAIIPGVIAGISLILVLISSRTLPLNSLGILLILTALVLLVAEIYVTSFGLLTVGAIACFVLGSLFLFDTEQADVKVPLGFIIGSAAGLGTIGLLIGTGVARSFKKKQTAGKEALVGTHGKVEDAIYPGKIGKIFFNGEFWNAASDQVIDIGQKVEVVKVDGLILTVKKI